MPIMPMTPNTAIVIRAAFEVLLASLEGTDPAKFFEAVRAAVVKRGRKPRGFLTQVYISSELEYIAADYEQVAGNPVLCDLSQALDLLDCSHRVEPDRPTRRTSVQAAPEEP